MPKTSSICSAVSIEHRFVTDGQTDTDTGPWLVPRVHSIARYAIERARRVDRRKCDQQSSTVDSRDDPRAVAKLFKSGVWDTVPDESFLVSEES